MRDRTARMAMLLGIFALPALMEWAGPGRGPTSASAWTMLALAIGLLMAARWRRQLLAARGLAPVPTPAAPARLAMAANWDLEPGT